MRTRCTRWAGALLALLFGAVLPAHLAFEHAGHAHAAHPAGCRDAAHDCAGHSHDAPGLHAVCDNHDARGCGQTHCHAHDVQDHLKASIGRTVAPAAVAALPGAAHAPCAQPLCDARPDGWVQPPGDPPHRAGTPHRGPPHA